MIPMDSIDLNSVPIDSPSIEKLDTVRRKSERPQNSTASKSTAQHLLMGGCLGKGHSHCVDPGAIVEEVFKPDQPDFQKAGDAELKQQRLTRSHKPTEKTRSTVKNSIRLGYILYEATTPSWVTFSYELTGKNRQKVETRRAASELSRQPQSPRPTVDSSLAQPPPPTPYRA